MDNNSIISDAVKYGLGEGQIAANIADGATLGVGLHSASLDAATPLIFTPTQFIVLHTPSMYKNTPEVGTMIKALIETHATAVSGVDVTYSLETAETPVGHDGQQMQVPTQTKREAVTPSFTFTEVTGNLVWNLFVQWMTDIQDPDTNASMARMEDDDIQFMSSAYSMSMVGIQFDPSGMAKNIIDAAFYTNMFPTDPGGSLGMERNIATSKTMERAVNFTGHVQHNKTTLALGKEVASIMQDAKVRYGGLRAPYNPAVADAIANSGIKQEVEALVSA
jgi:hypothetical protein